MLKLLIIGAVVFVILFVVVWSACWSGGDTRQGK